jgi:hypothetical protein
MMFFLVLCTIMRQPRQPDTTIIVQYQPHSLFKGIDSRKFAMLLLGPLES